MNEEYDDYKRERPYFERRYEEGYYIRFIEAALNIMLKEFNVSKEELVKAIEDITKCYDYSSKTRFLDIDFNKFHNLCAYLYRFGPLSAGLTRYLIIDAVNNCEAFRSYLQNLSGHKNSVVSVGGGPGCDIIGFCSGVNEIIDCQELQLTVVDNVEGWKPFLREMESLAREGCIEDLYYHTKFRFQALFRKMNISMSFIWQDVSPDADVSKQYSNALKTADVVLMKSLLSVLPKSCVFSTAANISVEMKKGAMLLFIDDMDFDFSQLGLEEIYTTVRESDETLKYSRYHFQEHPEYSYGPSFSPSSTEQLTVYVKKIE